jgi:iron complex transport system ATP-binding protein
MREMDVLDFAERPFNALSGGERQRVVLASAIARKPAVLFLDEPTSQLDIGHAIRFVGLVLELRKRLGMTVVVVSHDVQLMSGFLPRMVVMRDGRVVADGPTEEVVTAEMLDRVYGCRVETSPRKDGGVAILPEIPRP